MLKIVVIAAAVGLFAAGTAEQSAAQGLRIGPGGVELDTGVRRGPPRIEEREEREERIGRREATSIARDEGMRDVVSVDRDGGVYIVRGEDRRGTRMRVEIDARSGRVLEVRRRD